MRGTDKVTVTTPLGGIVGIMEMNPGTSAAQKAVFPEEAVELYMRMSDPKDGRYAFVVLSLENMEDLRDIFTKWIDYKKGVVK